MEEGEEEEPPPLQLVKFDSLPKDIIFDIFSRIPLKKLYQLSCVSKKWLLYLHQNPEFREFYHQKHKMSPLLVFNHQSSEIPSSTQFSSCYIDGTQISQIPTNIAQSLVSTLGCHGILCLISNTNAFLYDPITKIHSNLPNSNNLSSTFTWAFGFCPFRNLFKLLHFYTIQKFDNFHYSEMQELMCEIVSIPSTSLGTNNHPPQGEWQFLGKCPYDVLGRKNYTYVDGKIYWLISEKKFNPDYIKIMSFNLEIENFGVVCFPRSCSNRSVECLDLVEIKGKLCLTDRLPWNSSMDIWMMVKEDKGFANLWVKKYKIDLMGIDHHDVRILGHFPRNSSDYDYEGEILMKIGAKNFGFYELDNGIYRDMANAMNKQGWGLQVMLYRKFL